MQEVMDGTSRKLSDLLDSHGTVQVTIHNVCCHCGKVTETTLEVEKLFAEMFDRNTQHSCPECSERIKTETTAGDIAIRTQIAVEESGIPEAFLTWDKEKGNNALGKAIALNADKSLFIQGHFNTGKSRAACANLKLQIQKGKSGKFVRFSDIANRYQRTFSNGETEPDTFIDNLMNGIDILVIDDIGKRRITQTAGELLFGILDRIYCGQSMCRVWLTSNIAVKDLANKFESADSGDAVVSRIDRMAKENKAAVITA